MRVFAASPPGELVRWMRQYLEPQKPKETGETKGATGEYGVIHRTRARRRNVRRSRALQAAGLLQRDLEVAVAACARRHILQVPVEGADTTPAVRVGGRRTITGRVCPATHCSPSRIGMCMTVGHTMSHTSVSLMKFSSQAPRPGMLMMSSLAAFSVKSISGLPTKEIEMAPKQGQSVVMCTKQRRSCAAHKQTVSENASHATH